MRRLPGAVSGTRSYRLKPVSGRKWIVEYVDLADPLRFIVAGDSRILTVPPGFSHDYASSPRWVWPIIGPPAGDGPGANFGPSAILHDRAYVHQRWDDDSPMKRWEADAILWEVCFDLHVDEWRRWTLYSSVRLGGWYYWNRRRKHDGRLR